MSPDKLPGRLPDREARLVLASGEYPELAEGLRRIGLQPVVTSADKRLPMPVRWHPDMQACAIGGRMIVLKGSGLLDILNKCGISAGETCAVPEPVYPKDVLCNALAWDRLILGNSKTVDRAVRLAAEDIGGSWIDVKQGYAACAAALADEGAVITSDPGIGRQLELNGFDVLRISPGNIKLPGYAYGFIGGCCGKLAPDMMAFSGSLDRHPDGGRIRAFLSERGIMAVELLEGELLDVGGLIALS